MSYDRNTVSAPFPGLRLLPWETDTGKPCFLSTNGTPGALARIADEIEADQLRDGADVLEGAQAVLDDRKAGEYALRHALRAATQALGDVLRIADSRGARLPVPDDDHDADSDNCQDDGADGTAASGRGVRMSAGNGTTRGRYRFAEWTLTAMPTMVVRHFSKCLTCGEGSADTADTADVQVWCLKHAGLTHHSGYELSAFQHFNATMTDPGEAPHTT